MRKVSPDWSPVYHMPELKKILADHVLRRELMIETIITTQAREGIVTTREQAEAAYDKARDNTN